MTNKLWANFGTASFFITWPLIFIYSWLTKPRTRVLIIHEQSALVVKNWLGSGNWALPGGGLHKGENPVDGAIREVQEELGFAIEKTALHELGLQKSYEHGRLISKYYLFAVQLEYQPEFVIDTKEITDHKWIHTDDLRLAEKGVSASLKDSLEAWTAYQNLI